MSEANHSNLMSQRKSHHLLLAEKAQVKDSELCRLFDYEPLLSGFPSEGQPLFPSFNVGTSSCSNPLWISSMTGGTGEAGHINRNLAKVAGEFGLGLGLGSCRPLLEDDRYFDDFNLRPLMGDRGVLFANFGLAQVDQELKQNRVERIFKICERLKVDGLFIHINPLQEYYQAEGDRWERSPLEIIDELIEVLPQGLELGVKEVGQGMGPASLRELLKREIGLLEFGAFGGTNFSYIESLREENSNKNKALGVDRELSFVGHSAGEMVYHVNRIKEELGAECKCHQFVISGGIRSYLQGLYLLENLAAEGVYGMAKPFLEAAQGDYQDLREFVQSHISGLNMAKQFLRAKPLPSAATGGIF